MSKKEEVLELIEFIKEKMAEMKLNAEKVFLNGNCGNLATILINEFSKSAKGYKICYKGEPWHIITKIDDCFYDITGETSLEKYCEYLNAHNDDEYKLEDFSLKETEYNDIRKQSNEYGYDPMTNESSVIYEMIKLSNQIQAKRNR